MKILYFTQRTKQKNPYSKSEVEHDLGATAATIKNKLTSNIDNLEITFASEIIESDLKIADQIKNFDLCLCDLTTHNGNYTYLAGLSEGLGKPVIYFCTNEHSPMPVLSDKNVLQYSTASLENEFKDKLISIIQLFAKDPSGFLEEIDIHSKKPKAFISYSHKDRDYLDRLMTHLKPLERKGMLDVWQDTQIKIGEKWRDKIDKALNDASIAILLLSADFMASDFIVENELPPLLSNAEVNGTKVVPVILSHCRFSREPTLNRFQAANLPSEPLSSMTSEEREAVYDRLASDIEAAIIDT